MADETPQPQPPQSTPFFSAWRPIVGWVSVVALVLKFIVTPLLGITLVLAGHPTEHIPAQLNFSDLMALMGTAVGFGGMRSLEKIKGIVK